MEQDILLYDNKMSLFNECENLSTQLLYYGGNWYNQFEALYISDLHLDTHLDIGRWESMPPTDVCADIATCLYKSMLMSISGRCKTIVFAGDIATGTNKELIECFFTEFMRYIDKLGCNIHVLYVLGNHEYVGFPSVDVAISYYRTALSHLGVYVLQNEHVIIDNTVIYGGTGFAKYNLHYNADNLCCCDVFTRQDEAKETDLFEQEYQKALLFAKSEGLCFLCISHYEPESCHSHTDQEAVYVSGHTHRNKRITTKNLVSYADGQVGYTSGDFAFRQLGIGRHTNPYINLADGYHETNFAEYEKFSLYAGLSPCLTPIERHYKNDQFYVMKYNNYYGFFIRTEQGTLIISGGQTRRVTGSGNLDWIYNNFIYLVKRYLTAMKPIRQVQQMISDEVQRLGFSGCIHGLIIDIDFYNHIIFNPVTKSVVFYYSPMFGEVKMFTSMTALLNHAASLPLYIDASKIRKVLRQLDEKPFTLPSGVTCQIDTFALPDASDLDRDSPEELQFVSRTDGLYGMSKLVSPLQRLFSAHTLQKFDVTILESEDTNRKKRTLLYTGRICDISSIPCGTYYVERDDGYDIIYLRDIYTSELIKLSIFELRGKIQKHTARWETKSEKESREQYGYPPAHNATGALPHP